MKKSGKLVKHLNFALHPNADHHIPGRIMHLLARLLTFVMHPLFIMTYFLLFLMAVQPYTFGVQSITDKQAIIMILGIVTSTVIMPGFGIVMLKPLGFVKSLDMPDKQDRIAPFIITGVFYIWVFKNFISGLSLSPFYSQVFLGATISMFLAFFVNIFYKVSIHMTGCGGLLAGVILLITQSGKATSLGIPLPANSMVGLSLNAVLLIVLILTGATASARLKLNAHTNDQLLFGLVIGIFGQILAMILMR